MKMDLIVDVSLLASLVMVLAPDVVAALPNPRHETSDLPAETHRLENLRREKGKNVMSNGE